MLVLLTGVIRLFHRDFQTGTEEEPDAQQRRAEDC